MSEVTKNVGMNLTLWKIEFNDCGIAYVISEKDSLMEAMKRFIDNYDRKDEAGKKVAEGKVPPSYRDMYKTPDIKSIKKLSSVHDDRTTIAGGLLFTEEARAELQKKVGE